MFWLSGVDMLGGFEDRMVKRATQSRGVAGNVVLDRKTRVSKFATSHASYYFAIIMRTNSS